MKKALGIILICILLLELYPARQYALAVTNGLMIDAQSLYPDMDSTYEEGYNPRIADGKAYLVLPLYHVGSELVTDETVTASVDYGAVNDTPFVVKQYQKSVKAEAVTQEGNAGKKIYLVKFELALKADRVNGIYPVTIDVQYNAFNIENSGELSYTAKEQRFTVYVAIQDGRAPGGESAPKPDAGIRLEGCTIDPQLVSPGSNFTINATLKNTGKKSSIKNIRVSYDNPEGVLIPTDHTGTAYVEQLEAGGAASLSMKMQAAEVIQNHQQKVIMTITYEDSDGNKYSDSQNIYIAIRPAGEDSSQEAAPPALKIDTSHTYSGMDTSYQAGYVPAVHKDKVNLVLPLLFSGEGKVRDNEIMAAVGYTDMTGQTLKVKSYEKSFQLQQLTSREGDKGSVYLVQFALELQRDRINGVYPVTLSISYEAEGEIREQSFTVYVNITDGKDAEDNTEVPAPVEITPRIIIEDCAVTPSECRAGDTVTFQIALKNTSKTKDIVDMKLSYSSDSGDLMPIEHSSSIYLDRINAGGSKEITFQMKIAPEVTTSNQKLTINLEGTDDKADSVIEAESIYLYVKQAFDIQIDKPEIDAEVKSGKTEEIVIPIFNTGKSKIKNIICSLDMEGVIPSGSAFIGELEPAASAEATVKAIIANRKITDPDVAEEDKYGLARGKITVRYEDAEGNSYSQAVDIKTIIKPAAKEEEKPQGISSQWWISIIIGLAVIQLIVSAIMIYRRKRLL